jgi:DNA polymerase-3 subunit gamma/tau
MAQAFYRKWRPQTFDEVVGQEHVVRTLRNALTSGRVHHAYLFAGPRGTGKTTTARLLAKAVNCQAPEPSNRPCNACAICQAVNEGSLLDLIEIDAASNTGVDDVRELRERVGFRPNLARYKVYVIDEVHMLSNAAFNALLKTLEEPPSHAIFILATTEPHKILATILSRCQRLDFRRIPLPAIVARLERIAEREGLETDSEALTLVARQATGSMRDAESLLDQLAAYDAGHITVEEIRAAMGTGAEEAVMALVDALADGDVAQGLAIINQAVEQGTDPRQFARQIVQHLRALLMARMGSSEPPIHLSADLRERFRAQATRFTPRQLAQSVRTFNTAASEKRVAWQPQLSLELALVEAALPEEEPAPPAQRLVSSPPPAAAPPASGSRPAHKKPAPAPSQPASRPAEKKPPPAGSRSPASEPEKKREPAPPTPAPAERSTPGSSDSPTLERIQVLWEDMLSEIRSRNLSLEALLRSGEPLAIEGNALVIGFAYEFHKGKVSEEENRRLVEDVLGKLVGRVLPVRCILTSREDKPAASSKAAASAEHDEDQLVQAAVEKLGARVVEQSTNE